MILIPWLLIPWQVGGSNKLIFWDSENRNLTRDSSCPTLHSSEPITLFFYKNHVYKNPSPRVAKISKTSRARLGWPKKFIKFEVILILRIFFYCYMFYFVKIFTHARNWELFCWNNIGTATEFLSFFFCSVYANLSIYIYNLFGFCIFCNAKTARIYKILENWNWNCSSFSKRPLSSMRARGVTRVLIKKSV